MADQSATTATDKRKNVINVSLSDAGKELVELATGLENTNLSGLLRTALVEYVRKVLAANEMLDDAAKAELSRGMREGE